MTVHGFGRCVLGMTPLAKDIFWPIYRILDLIVVKLIVGADIPAGCVFGDGCVLGHGAKGVVLSDEAIFGDRVTIYHQVTVARHARVGNDVWIGPGAKILENVVIGDHVKIGANAVVSRDVPANATAVGVPARILVAGRDRDSSH
jgi:serine O-acetyltransferase